MTCDEPERGVLFDGTQSHKHCRPLNLALESIRLDELGEMAKIKRREIDFWRTVSQLVRQCFADCGGVLEPMARAGRGKDHSLVLRMLIDHKARTRGIRIKAN